MNRYEYDSQTGMAFDVEQLEEKIDRIESDLPELFVDKIIAGLFTYLPIQFPNHDLSGDDIEGDIVKILFSGAEDFAYHDDERFSQLREAFEEWAKVRCNEIRERFGLDTK